MAGPDDADEAREAAERADEARDEAIEARSRQTPANARPSQQARAVELLFHPDHAPRGRLGPPVRRSGRADLATHSPFYVGFFGGLGVLSALLVGFALREAELGLVLILVSFFLAVGLNPIVEWLMHRGFGAPGLCSWSRWVCWAS